MVRREYKTARILCQNACVCVCKLVVRKIDLMHWRHKGSHLHNNDASLVSRSAHVLCWQCALALSLSVRGPGRASPAVWLAGFAPLAACLAMTHVAVFRLTPNAAGRPSVTSYAYGLLKTCEIHLSRLGAKISTFTVYARNWCYLNGICILLGSK